MKKIFLVGFFIFIIFLFSGCLNKDNKKEEKKINSSDYILPDIDEDVDLLNRNKDSYDYEHNVEPIIPED